MTSSPDGAVELRRILGRRDVVSLAFGAMIGWGWVVLAGEMIERAGSLGSALAFVAGAVMVLLVGLTYAELTSALRRAGGELAFTFLGLGPGASFVCGWTLVLAYLTVCAFEAAALPTVVGYLFDGFDAGYLYTVAGWKVHATWVVVGVAGAVGVGAASWFGLRLASGVQVAATALLLLVGVALFVPGCLRGDSANLAPLFTTPSGFFRVVIMTPFLFVGFDVIPQVAEEVAVPFRAVGRLLLASIAMALVWYVLVQWTVSLVLDPHALAERRLATADAMAVVYGSPWGARALIVGGLMGIVTSWNAFFIGASRLVFAMARGGMLPSAFGRLNPRFGSPTAAIALLTVLTALAPFFGRQVLVWLVDAGGLAAVVAYLLVAISFLRIRRLYPGLPRPYVVPAGTLTGLAALLATALFVALYLPGSPSALAWPAEWAIVIAWALLGAALFLAVRSRPARMRSRDQARAILGTDVEASWRGPARA
jgi:basic amino acid/polyamine antiporter, APA family